MNNKIAFIFPGQGSQYIGMGKDLYDNIEECRSIFDRGNKILNMPIKEMIFEGDEEELKKTKYSQIAILLTSVACLKALELRGISAEYALGLSLGEYGALIYSNALSFEDGMKLVKKRAEIMDSAIDSGKGSMAAVLKLSPDKIEELVRKANDYGLVECANYNCPGQVVISGETDAIKASVKIGKELGGRVIPLKVSGPFHSSMYEEASYEFYKEIEKIDIKDFEKVVYSNVKGLPYKKSDDIKELLRSQITNPVLFENSIRDLLDKGVNTFIEVGPGKSLSGFVKKINSDVKIYNVEDINSLQKTIEELNINYINKLS